MNLQQKLTERITERFNNARINKTGIFAPRPGYFYIRETFLKEIAPFAEVQMAYVNWKSDLENPFIEDVIFEIAVTNLVADRPEQFIGLQFKDLAGKTIHIYNAVIIEKSINGKMEKALNCRLQLIEAQPQFINTQLAAINTYFKGSAEPFQNLINTAPYDVLEALDWEAQYGHQAEVWDAPEDNGDAWDAPDNYGDAFDEPDDEPEN